MAKCFLTYLCAVLLAACGGSHQAQDAPPLVMVSITPQAAFVERIAGERFAVEVLVPPGASPATYEPSARQMADLAQAEAFFAIGVPFEQALLPKLARSTPELPIVHTDAGIDKREMRAAHDEAGEQDEHGAAGEYDQHDHGHHDHDGHDPHIWLDPRLVKIQARHIADTLSVSDPDGAESYRANLAAFEAELDALDAELRAALEPVQGRSMLVFHPSWGYFADAYGLRQQAIEIEGKEPGARQLARLIERAQSKGVKVIFVQPQFSSRAAGTIAEAVGATVVRIDPLAPDYLANMRSIAEQVASALAEQR